MTTTKEFDARILEVEKQIAVLNLELIHLKQAREFGIRHAQVSESQFDSKMLLND